MMFSVKNWVLGASMCMVLIGCKPEKPLVPVPLTKAITGTPAPCEDLAYGGFPRSVEKTENTSFVCRQGYVLNYNAERNTSEWVVERVGSKDPLNPPPSSDESRFDPDLPPSKRSHADDYIGIGYVKRFFAPPQDFLHDDIQYSHAHYLSNAYPAHPDQVAFMDQLEEWIRQQGRAKGDLMVISGPVYEAGSGLGWVGVPNNENAGGEYAMAGKVQVPSHVYKILIDPKTHQSLVLLIPNGPVSGSVSQFVVPWEVLEKKTGLVFVPDLPSSTRATLRANPKW